VPIRPQHRWLYPIDWQQLTDMVRFERAKGRCEQCARPHGKLVCHLGDGRWWDEEAVTWKNDRGRPLRKGALPPPCQNIIPQHTSFLQRPISIPILGTMLRGTVKRFASGAISSVIGRDTFVAGNLIS
jgi:hypothetical protein